MARQKSSRIFDSAHQEAYLRIWRLHDRLSMLEEELLSSHGITSQQYNTLRLLQARHPETMPTLQIARRLISHAPDITRLLDRLEKNALIHRARSTTSRRVVEVGITPAGLALLKAMATPIGLLHERQVGHLSAAQLAELNSLLKLAGMPHEPDSSPWS